MQYLFRVLLWALIPLFAVPGWSQPVVDENDHESLSEVPVRIAALNWTQTEFLLTLGITPAGVTSIKGYRHWQSDHPVLPQGVVELGHRAEPSMEALRQLQPDLILGYSWRHARLHQRLQNIAPTVLYSQYPSEDDPRNYLDRMRSNYRAVAAMLERSEQAEQQLQQLDQTISEARREIEQAGLKGEKVLVGKFVGMGLGLRAFGDSSLAGAVLSELGLENAWSRTLPGRDFTHIDLLQLPLVGDASLLLTGEPRGDARVMTRSAVWQQLPAVQQQRVYQMPQLWSYGGPVSASRMVQEIVRQLTGRAAS